jgi:hypothetical protein
MLISGGELYCFEAILASFLSVIEQSGYAGNDHVHRDRVQSSLWNDDIRKVL